MAERGRRLVRIINVNIIQEGDTRVEDNRTTHIVDSSIGQLNIRQDPSTEINEEAHVIIQEVKEQNPTTSNKTPVKSERKSGEYKDQNAAKNEEALVIIQEVRKQDPTTPVPTSVNSEQKSGDDKDQNAAKNEEALEIIQEVRKQDPTTSVPTSVNSERESGDDKDQNAAKNEEAPVIIPEVKESNPTTSVQTSDNSNRKRKKYQEKKLLDQNYTDENPKKKYNSMSTVQCDLLTVHAASLCGETKFTEAESVLKKLTELQQGDVGVSALILIAEVYVHLGKKKEAEEAMGVLECLPIASLSDIHDRFEHASDLISHKSFVRALVLLRISSDMHQHHTPLSPDDIIKIISVRVGKIDDAVRPMIESGHKVKTIALEYGLPYMVKMVNDLKDVKKPNTSIKALNLAFCHNKVGFNYDLSNEYNKSIEFRKCGVDIMEREFKNKASRYHIYGNMLYNLGQSHQSLSEFEHAENYFNKAIKAYENARDFVGQDKRQKEIEITKNQLKILHASFKKVSPKPN